MWKHFALLSIRMSARNEVPRARQRHNGRSVVFDRTALKSFVTGFRQRAVQRRAAGALSNELKHRRELTRLRTERRKSFAQDQVSIEDSNAEEIESEEFHEAANVQPEKPTIESHYEDTVTHVIVTQSSADVNISEPTSTYPYAPSYNTTNNRNPLTKSEISKLVASYRRRVTNQPKKKKEKRKKDKRT